MERGRRRRKGKREEKGEDMGLPESSEQVKVDLLLLFCGSSRQSRCQLWDSSCCPSCGDGAGRRGGEGAVLNFLSRVARYRRAAASFLRPRGTSPPFTSQGATLWGSG